MKLSDIREAARKKYGVDRFQVEGDDGNVVAEFHSFLCLSEDRKKKVDALRREDERRAAERRKAIDDGKAVDVSSFEKFDLLREQMLVLAVNEAREKKFLAELSDRDLATLWDEYERETQQGEAESSPTT